MSPIHINALLPHTESNILPPTAQSSHWNYFKWIWFTCALFYFPFLSTINKSVLHSSPLKIHSTDSRGCFSSKSVEKMWTNSIWAWLWHHLLLRRGAWHIPLSVHWQLLPFLLFSYLSYTAPSAAPKNFTFELSEQQLTLSWAALEQEELCGRLLAYKVQWKQGGENQVHHYKGRHTYSGNFTTLTLLLTWTDSTLNLYCFQTDEFWNISHQEQ